MVGAGRKFLPATAFRRVRGFSGAAVGRLGHPGINLVVAHMTVVYLTVVYLTVIPLTVVHLTVIAFTTIDSAGRTSRISGRLRPAADVATGMAGRRSKFVPAAVVSSGTVLHRVAVCRTTGRAAIRRVGVVHA